VSYESALEKVDPGIRGIPPPGSPYSLWQLAEHLRLTQLDILDFCRNSDYVEPRWPDDYWPPSAAPPDGGAWERSITSFLADRAELVRLAQDPGIDLFATIPHG